RRLPQALEDLRILRINVRDVVEIRQRSLPTGQGGVADDDGGEEADAPAQFHAIGAGLMRIKPMGLITVALPAFSSVVGLQDSIMAKGLHGREVSGSLPRREKRPTSRHKIQLSAGHVVGEMTAEVPDVAVKAAARSEHPPSSELLSKGPAV